MSSEEPLAGGNVGAVVRVGSPVGARTLTATSGVRNSSGPASGTTHGTASGTATNTRARVDAKKAPAGTQLPLNSGLRFSAKAAMPSWRSSLANAAASSFATSARALADSHRASATRFNDRL
jgi:hypothetical protein